MRSSRAGNTSQEAPPLCVAHTSTQQVLTPGGQSPSDWHGGGSMVTPEVQLQKGELHSSDYYSDPVKASNPQECRK